MEKNTVQAKQLLYKYYGDSASGKSLIIYWYAEFKRGHTDTNDAERSQWTKNNNVLVILNLDLSKHNKKDFLIWYVAMNEMWIHHNTPEANRQSAG